MGVIQRLTLRSASTQSVSAKVLVLLFLLGTSFVTDALGGEENNGDGSWFRKGHIHSSFALEDTFRKWTIDRERQPQAFIEGSGDGETSLNADDAIASSTVVLGRPAQPPTSTTPMDYDDFSDGTEPSVASSELEFINTWGLSRSSLPYLGPSATSPETTATPVTPEPDYQTTSFTNVVRSKFTPVLEMVTLSATTTSGSISSLVPESIFPSFSIYEDSGVLPVSQPATSPFPADLTPSLSYDSAGQISNSAAESNHATLLDLEGENTSPTGNPERVNSTVSSLQPVSIALQSDSSTPTMELANTSTPLNYLQRTPIEPFNGTAITTRQLENTSAALRSRNSTPIPSPSGSVTATRQPHSIATPWSPLQPTSFPLIEDIVTTKRPTNTSKPSKLLQQTSFTLPSDPVGTISKQTSALNPSNSTFGLPSSYKSDLTSNQYNQKTSFKAAQSSIHPPVLTIVPTATSPPNLASTVTPYLGREASPYFSTELLPTRMTDDDAYTSGPSDVWTLEKSRQESSEAHWHSSVESNRPRLLWFTTSPPATRKTDWFLSTMSKWFVQQTETPPQWDRSSPPSSVRPTAVFNSFGHLDNGEEQSPEALNDQMKYWIRTVLRIERYNHSNTERLARNLAFVYEKAFAQRQAARRGKRYTGRSMEVQVVNLSVDYKDQLMSLVYTLSQEGKPVPVETAVDAMTGVNETDMSRLLGYQVVTKAEPYVKPTKTESSSVSRLAWIVTGVLAAIFVLVVLFLILYCKCCRPKIHRSPYSDPGSVRSYGRENRRKMFEESPGKFGGLGEKTYRDVFTSPIHVPSAPPVEIENRAMRNRPKNLSEYFVNKAYEPDRRQNEPTVPSSKLYGSEDYDEVDHGLDEIQGGLFDHVPEPTSDAAECPLPLPRKNFQSVVHREDSGSDSDTSLESTTSAESAEQKTERSHQSSVATSILSDENSEANDAVKTNKPSSDEELKEAQKELDNMKKKIGDILDSALEKAAAKKVYGRLPFPPEEAPEKKDVLTQTTADLPAGKPRVVWSIYKTSEAAAQTSFLDCRLTRGDTVSSPTADLSGQSPTKASSIRDSTQAMLSAIRGELQKFSVAQRAQNGESFA
ncbi:uncharacterized protein LOC144174826 isoform X2 [Haemaphysalis longicornis]